MPEGVFPAAVGETVYYAQINIDTEQKKHALPFMAAGPFNGQNFACHSVWE